MSAPSSGTRTFHMIEAVADRFEGAPRQLRRRWSDDFKARAVAEALEPGSSVSAIARRLDIHPSQLFGWRRAALGPHKESTGPSGYKAVMPSAGVAIIEVLIGDVVVRAPVDADEAHLQRVIRAVRSA